MSKSSRRAGNNKYLADNYWEEFTKDFKLNESDFTALEEPIGDDLVFPRSSVVEALMQAIDDNPVARKTEGVERVLEFESDLAKAEMFG